MTKERILNTAEAMKFTSRGYLRWLQTVPSGVSHETTLYEIKPIAPLSGYTRCGSCEEKGKFLLHDKDHLNEHSINIMCADHSPEMFFKVLESRNSA
jgi:hypothetical protein